MTIAATFFSPPATTLPVEPSLEALAVPDAGFAANVDAALHPAGDLTLASVPAERTRFPSPLLSFEPGAVQPVDGLPALPVQREVLMPLQPSEVQDTPLLSPATGGVMGRVPSPGKTICPPGNEPPTRPLDTPAPAPKLTTVAPPPPGVWLHGGVPPIATPASTTPPAPMASNSKAATPLEPTVEQPQDGRGDESALTMPALTTPAQPVVALPQSSAVVTSDPSAAEASAIAGAADVAPAPASADARAADVVTAQATPAAPLSPAMDSARQEQAGASGLLSAPARTDPQAASAAITSPTQAQIAPAPLQREVQPRLSAERGDLPLARPAPQTTSGERTSNNRKPRDANAPVPIAPPSPRLHAPAASPPPVESTAEAGQNAVTAPLRTADLPPVAATTDPLKAMLPAGAAPISASSDIGAATSTPAAAVAPVQAAAAPIQAVAAPESAKPVLAAPIHYAAPPAEPEIAARAGHVGHAVGVAIAKRITSGGEELTVRLNPAEFGKVDVRMTFDEGGTLRAVVAAERPDALDLLRRDSADLTRAMVDAGIRTDQQSFRFDARAGGGDAQGFWQRQQQQQQRQQHGGNSPDGTPSAAAAAHEPVYRQVRTAGRVNLMA